MKNFSESDRNIWLSDFSRKNYTAVIDGVEYGEEIISTESIKITEILEDGTQLNFIGCKARKLEVAIINTSTEFVNKSIVIKATASLGESTTEEVLLFSGTVAAVKQKSQSDIMVTLTAYDHMADVIEMDLAEWYKGLTFPMSLRAFRQALPAELRVKDEVLPFDDVVIEKTVEPDILPAKEVLGAISSMNGRFCTCNTEGEVIFKELLKYDYHTLNPEDDLYPAEDLFPQNPSTVAEHIAETEYINAAYEDYIVATIDKVQIRSEENDIGAIYGTGTNAYVLQGNFLLFGKGTAELTDIAQRLLSIVEGILYSPAKIECKGRPWVELGDLVRVFTEKKVVYSYVLQRVWSGMNFISDTYQSKQTCLRSEQVNTVNTQIIQLRGKANKLTRDIEHLVSEIYNEDGSSKIEQNAQSISAKVEKTGGSQSFSWELLADGFVLKCGNKEVFRCDANGIVVNGYAQASEITAINTNIQNLFTNEANLGTAIAEKAAIKDLNAANGRIDTLNTSVASLGTAVVGKLTTNELATNIAGLNYVSVKNLGCNVFNVSANGRAYTLRPAQVTIGGKQRIALVADV